ncbi:MAG: FHA domain-containing protein [Anaerolineae bacterium]|nr:FHA domain-containing protein [Anaerolineae bacterium]
MTSVIRGEIPLGVLPFVLLGLAALGVSLTVLFLIGAMILNRRRSRQGPVAPDGPQSFRLAVTEGPFAGQTFLVGASPFKVGREPQFGNVVLSEEYVSNPHCTIYREGERFFIADENSTNGTLLDGRKLPPYKRVTLNLNATIQIGSTVLRFEPFVPVPLAPTRVMPPASCPPNFVEPLSPAEEAATRVIAGCAAEEAATRIVVEPPPEEIPASVPPEEAVTRLMDE